MLHSQATKGTPTIAPYATDVLSKKRKKQDTDCQNVNDNNIGTTTIAASTARQKVSNNAITGSNGTQRRVRVISETRRAKKLNSTTFRETVSFIAALPPSSWIFFTDGATIRNPGPCGCAMIGCVPSFVIDHSSTECTKRARCIRCSGLSDRDLATKTMTTAPKITTATSTATTIATNCSPSNSDNNNNGHKVSISIGGSGSGSGSSNSNSNDADENDSGRDTVKKENKEECDTQAIEIVSPTRMVDFARSDKSALYSSEFGSWIKEAKSLPHGTSAVAELTGVGLALTAIEYLLQQQCSCPHRYQEQGQRQQEKGEEVLKITDTDASASRDSAITTASLPTSMPACDECAKDNFSNDNSKRNQKEISNKRELELQSIVILTDSMYAINILTNASWKAAQNVELITKLKSQLNRVHSLGGDVTMKWVPAHVGVPCNEEVDRLASEAANAP